MIVDIINSSTNEIIPFEVLSEELEEFTTNDLYEYILYLLDVKESKLLMYYNNKKIDDSSILLCKNIFTNIDYAKINIYPNMVSSAIFNSDIGGYNYVDFIQESYRQDKLEEMKEDINYDKKVAQLNRILRKRKIYNKARCKRIKIDMKHPDMNCQYNQETKNKMTNILSKMKK